MNKTFGKGGILVFGGVGSSTTAKEFGLGMFLAWESPWSGKPGEENPSAAAGPAGSAAAPAA